MGEGDPGLIILLAVASDALYREGIESMSVTAASPGLAVGRTRLLEPAQQILIALLAFEIVVFAAIGTNFLTRPNAFEVLRLSVEIGLLAVALTPVIVSGGIDLSVGSLMGCRRCSSASSGATRGCRSAWPPR